MPWRINKQWLQNEIKFGHISKCTKDFFYHFCEDIDLWFHK